MQPAAGLTDKLLNKITTHPVEKRNVRSLSLNMMIKSADMPLFSGTELQAFQVKLGLATSQMGMIASFGQIAAVISYFLLMGVADRISNRVRVYSIFTASMAVYPALLIFLSLAPDWMRHPGIAVPVMAIGTISESVLISFMALIFSALFVRAISAGIQGKFMSIMGVGGGLLGLFCGYISSNALLYLGYPHGFTVAFVMGAILLLIAAIVVKNVKEIPELSTGAGSKSISPIKAFRSVVGTREFKLLLLPNTLRGLCGGASYFAMATGMKQLGLGVEFAGYTTMLIFLGGMIGTASIGFTVDRYGAGKVLLFSNLCMAVSLMGVVLAPSAWLFLIFFFTMYISFSCEGITIPLAHYVIVPQQIIGAFSAVRLMLLYGTGAIAVIVNGYLLDIFGSVLVFSINALINVVTGILWLYAFNKGHKPQPVAALAQSGNNH
jgi:MFS family permease